MKSQDFDFPLRFNRAGLRWNLGVIRMSHAKLTLGLVTIFSVAACGNKRSTDGYASAVVKLAGDNSTRGIGGATFYAQQQMQDALVQSMRGLSTRADEADMKPQASVTITAQTTTCPGGSGTAVTSGSADYSYATSGGSLTWTFNDMDLTTAFTDCVVEGDDGKTYTINGTSNLTNVTGTFTTSVSGISSSMTLPLTGTVSIAGDSETKSNCAIDVTSTNTMSSSNGSLEGTASWSGTVCGASMNGTTTFSTAVPTFLLEL